MKTALGHVRDCFRFLTSDVTTITILTAVAGTCFFAFVMGAEQELVYGLLGLGLITALVEARLHANSRDK